MMQKYLHVVADMNDADYTESFQPIDDKTLKKLRPLFKAIKNFKPYTGKSDSGMTFSHNHNFPHGEHVPREDLGEKTVDELYPDHDDAIGIFKDGFVPWGEYGIHSIKEIEVINVSDIEKII